MQPSYNILAFVTVLVVSSRSAPPDIGRGSFSYDPNSIAQNEDILRLFLRLASHTANRLIYLKNEAKQKPKLEESKPSLKVDSPALRLGLPENVTEKTVAVRGYPGNDYGRGIGPYFPATEDSLIGGNIPGRYRSRSTRRENDHKSKNLDNDAEEIVEVKNRALFDLDKSNLLPNYDNSRITSDVDTKAKNIILPYQGSASNILQSGPLLVSHIVGSTGFHENQKESNTNQANIVTNKVEASNSSDHEHTSQNAGSGSSSEKPTELEKQSVINASNLQSILGSQSVSTVTGIANQSVTAASNLQSQPIRLINSAQGIASGILKPEPTKLINSVQSMASSDLQSEPNNLINFVQSMSSGILKPETTKLISSVQDLSSEKLVAKPIGIMNPVKSIASENLQSGSKGVINSLGSVASSGQSVVKSEMTPVNLVSNVQSSPLKYLPTVQDVASKMVIKTLITANGTQADQIMTSMVDNRGNQNAGNNSNPNPINSGGMLQNTNPARILMDHEASLTNLSKIVSLKEVQNPALTVTRDSTGQAGKILDSLTGISSTFTGSFDSQHDTKTGGSGIDTGYQQGNSALLISKTSGVNTFGHGDESHDVQNAKHGLIREGAVSAADLKNYADQFANALRPVSAAK